LDRLHREWVMSLRASRKGEFLCMKVCGKFDEEVKDVVYPLMPDRNIEFA
jgi:hypothetical protein